MIGARGLRVGRIKGIAFERSRGGEKDGPWDWLGIGWAGRVWSGGSWCEAYEAATVFQQLSRDGWRREGHW